MRSIFILILLTCLSNGIGMAGELSPNMSQSFSKYNKLENQPEIIQKLTDENHVGLIVILKSSGEDLQPRKTASKESRQAVHEAMQNLRKPVIDRLPSEEVTFKRSFRYLPAFAVKANPEGLQRLLEMDEVKAVAYDRPVYAHTFPELTLVDALTVRSVYDGSGAAVAVCDTGVDYTHSMLDGDKYLGGYDFGDLDSNPMDLHGHGTSVAGIAVGESGTSGTYVGGVAPAAGYYALKITSGSSDSASFSAIIDAWEWAVDHQYDSAENPIVAINTSFGSESGFDAVCDNEDAAFQLLYTAAAQARSAGILVLASSGNSGYTSAISAPACLSNVTSVGAVSDYDTVASFSNAADILDILAPGVSIRTTSRGGSYRSFSGTSASAPFAAGVAVLLQSIHHQAAGSFLPPDDLQSKLEDYGAMITDTRPNPDIVKPRTEVGGTDIDGDGLPVAWEVENFGTVSTDSSEDTDGDTLLEIDEYGYGTDPNLPDTDGDDLPDGWEIENETDPLVDDADEDPDNDGYTNLEEYEAETDPQDAESHPAPATSVPGFGTAASLLTFVLLLIPAGLYYRRRESGQA